LSIASVTPPEGTAGRLRDRAPKDMAAFIIICWPGTGKR
jgi:hypothetical protein